MREPLLLDGLKFDVRLYVLITSCDPLKLFLFHEGIVRLATEPFEESQNTMENMFVHLTNYAINKDNADKFKSPANALDDEGHKRSFQTILNRFKREGVDTDKMMDQIKDIVVKTMLCI